MSGAIPLLPIICLHGVKRDNFASFSLLVKWNLNTIKKILSSVKYNCTLCFSWSLKMFYIELVLDGPDLLHVLTVPTSSLQ